MTLIGILSRRGSRCYIRK